jgi:hypothetical protein
MGPVTVRRPWRRSDIDRCRFVISRTRKRRAKEHPAKQTSGSASDNCTSITCPRWRRHAEKGSANCDNCQGDSELLYHLKLRGPQREQTLDHFQFTKAERFVAEIWQTSRQSNAYLFAVRTVGMVGTYLASALSPRQHGTSLPRQSFPAIRGAARSTLGPSTTSFPWSRR